MSTARVVLKAVSTMHESLGKDPAATAIATMSAAVFACLVIKRTREEMIEIMDGVLPMTQELMEKLEKKL